MPRDNYKLFEKSQSYIAGIVFTNIFCLRCSYLLHIKVSKFGITSSVVIEIQLWHYYWVDPLSLILNQTQRKAFSICFCKCYYYYYYSNIITIQEAIRISWTAMLIKYIHKQGTWWN